MSHVISEDHPIQCEITMPDHPTLSRLLSISLKKGIDILWELDMHLVSDDVAPDPDPEITDESALIGRAINQGSKMSKKVVDDWEIIMYL